jgi:hypothetical protein
MAFSKKIRITVVLSAIWFMLVLIFAIKTTEKGRYFHFDDFFLVLIIGALLPPTYRVGYYLDPFCIQKARYGEKN